MLRIAVIIFIGINIVFCPLNAKQLIIDYEKSTVKFWLRHFLIFTAYGTFSDYKGNILWDPQRNQTDFMGTIKVNSISTGLDKFNDQLMSPPFFNEKEFPLIEYESMSIQATSTHNYEVVGQLTCKGISKIMTENMTVTSNITTESTKRWKFHTIFPINRYEFDLASHINWPVVDHIVYVELNVYADEK